MSLRYIFKIACVCLSHPVVFGLSDLTAQYYLERRETVDIKLITAEKPDVIIQAPFMRVEVEQSLLSQLHLENTLIFT